jgi:hypothetical protein
MTWHINENGSVDDNSTAYGSDDHSFSRSLHAFRPPRLQVAQCGESREAAQRSSIKGMRNGSKATEAITPTRAVRNHVNDSYDPFLDSIKRRS